MWGSKARDAILRTLRASPYPLPPKVVSSRSGVNHNTVRVYLRRLLDLKEVEQPFWGYYSVTKPTDGVGSIRVHNVRLRVESPFKIAVHKEGLITFGDSYLRVVWGVKNQLITGWIVSPDGLDYSGFELAIQRFLSQTGVSESEVAVSTVELNTDLAGLRLDGLSSWTLSDLRGTLKRVYTKDGRVRAEVKTQPRSLAEIQTLLRSDGGVPVMDLVGEVAGLNEGFGRVADAVKGMSGMIKGMGDAFDRLATELRKR